MAWNDPDWGKKNNGPPDLDELWRKFNDKLNGLFGIKTPKPNRPVPVFIIPVTLLIIVAIWLATGMYIVNAGERGVVLRFGKLIDTTQPGLNWHLPYPIESVNVVNVEQVRTVEIGYRENVQNKLLKESLMLTDDENIVDIQFSVQYTITNPEDYLFNNRSPDDAVRQVAESIMSEIVGKSKMDYVLYEGRADIADRAAKHIQTVLDLYQTGIHVSKVTLQNAQPPQEVQPAFDDAVKAGQDRERLKNEGEAYANDVIPKARGVAARLTEEAAGYKQSVIADATGDADRFKQVLAQYSKAPEVTRERMYLDTMQQVLSNTTKIMTTGDKSGGQMLYLPLDKLIGLSNSAAPANGVASTTSTATPAATAAGVPVPAAPAGITHIGDTKVNTRDAAQDAMRSRDREDRP
uniref:Protein HflK n=1 Tax=mine drainage metagenome TaxID=410659 RepID=E6QTG8_9ZZZZ